MGCCSFSKKQKQAKDQNLNQSPSNSHNQAEAEEEDKEKKQGDQVQEKQQDNKDDQDPQQIDRKSKDKKADIKENQTCSLFVLAPILKQPMKRKKQDIQWDIGNIEDQLQNLLAKNDRTNYTSEETQEVILELMKCPE